MDTISVGNTVDLAVTIPYQLGYHPAQSLAVVGLLDRRVLGVMRMDLCEPDQHAVGAECLTTFARAGADGVILVAFEDRPSQGASLLRSFRDGAATHGIVVYDSLVIRAGKAFAVSATGHALGRGRPVPDPSRVPAVAELVAHGRAPLPGRQSLTALVECEETTASREVGARVASLRATPGAGEPTVTSPSVAAWGALLAQPYAPLADPALVAVAVVGLLDRDWRDGLLAWLCPDTLSPDQVRDDVRAALPQVPRPADDAADDLQHRLFGLCRLVPDDVGDVAAAVLTVAAHVAWCDGDGTVASIALDRALRIDPGYRLAQLLDRLVGAGIRAADSRARTEGRGNGAAHDAA